MMANSQNAVVFLLCLLLAAWSAESAQVKQGALSQGQRVRGAKHVEVEDEADEGSDEDDDGDDDSNKEEEKVAGPEKEEKADSEGFDSIALSQVSKSAPAAAPPAYETAAAPAAASEEEESEEKPLSPQAAHESKLQKAVRAAKEALSDNTDKQEELKDKMKDLSDPSKSSEEIDATAKLVANETESVAMAGMLSGMWKDMRMFEVPVYTEHVKDELAHLEKEQPKLKAKLEAAKKKLKAFQKNEEIIEEEEKKSGEALKVDEEEEEPTKKKKVSTNEHWAIDTGDKWNFWSMESKQKESFLAGSFVYVVAGLALAFLHNKARTRHPKIFAPKPCPDVSRNSQEFSFSLFGCFGSPNVCVMGCCFPCLGWADTMDRSGLMSYWKAFLTFFVLTALYGYTGGLAPLVVVALGVYYRQKLRKSYGFDSGTPRSVAFDIAAWLCCQPCAIIQEAREVSAAAYPGMQDP